MNSTHPSPKSNRQPASAAGLRAAHGSALRQFTTDDLMEEIVRRRNIEETREEIVPCDECAHFKAWTGPISKDAPASWNCCGKGHKQSFRLPRTHTDLDWGFYRRVCADRVQKQNTELTGSSPVE